MSEWLEARNMMNLASLPLRPLRILLLQFLHFLQEKNTMRGKADFNILPDMRILADIVTGLAWRRDLMVCCARRSDREEYHDYLVRFSSPRRAGMDATPPGRRF
jgi:hypothetical protein